MRLINISTGKLQEFFAVADIPAYAILSHTWGREEVTFQDFCSAPTGSGEKYRKIELCCQQAERDDLKYVWIDTCCIDKTSSAELSEAINSMYKWYSNSAVCYAFLSDVSSQNPKPVGLVSDIEKSRWFTRGWTLQELLAPRTVVFYSKEWTEIGTRSTLYSLISRITRIDHRVLLKARKEDTTIAQKMSWAANRETTRIEDIAYCLLGIFGVQMPVLYGEGKNAFSRLQHEIMKVSNDQTIFAWHSSETEIRGGGLLADSPSDFADSGEVERYDFVDSSYSMTNKGLRIELPLVPYKDDITYRALLNCRFPEISQPLGIYVRRGKGDEFVRIDPAAMFVAENQSTETTTQLLYVKEKDSFRYDASPGSIVILISTALDSHGFSLKQRSRNLDKDKETGNFRLEGWRIEPGLLLFENQSGEKFAVVLGINCDSGRVWTDLVIGRENETGDDLLNSCLSAGKSAERVQKFQDKSIGFISGDRIVSVALRTGSDNTATAFMNITRADSILSWPDPSLTSKPPPQYRFVLRDVPSPQTVSSQLGIPDSDMAEFCRSTLLSSRSELEVYPRDSWATLGFNLVLSTGGGAHPESGTVILVYRNRTKIALTLGVYDNHVWCDIRTILDTRPKVTSRFKLAIGDDASHLGTSNENVQSIHDHVVRMRNPNNGNTPMAMYASLVGDGAVIHTEVSNYLSGTSGPVMHVKTRDRQLLGEFGFQTMITVKDDMGSSSYRDFYEKYKKRAARDKGIMAQFN